jgi:glycerophosphoryl diester phosphodiesterase
MATLAGTAAARLAASLCAAVLLLPPAGGADSRPFDLQGHRGARGLAPENTMPAFRKAVSLGVDTLETDLAVTRDGVLVLSHDPVLNPSIVRSPDGEWLAAEGPPIHSLPLSELRRFDVGRLDPDSKYAKQWPEQHPADGERFPTLREFIDAFSGSTRNGAPLRFSLETKLTPTSGSKTPDPATFARLVVAAVREAKLVDRVAIQSFDWRTLVEVKRLAPEISTACLTIRAADRDNVQPGPDGVSPWLAGLRLDDHGGSVPRLVKAAGCSTWSAFWRNLDAENLAEAHGLGLKVLAWTVNSIDDMERLIALGIDGLITDYPDRAGDQRVRAALARRPLKP